MAWVGALFAVAMIVVVLVDAFEVVLLPRRIRHGFRLARMFFRTSWLIGRTAARLLPTGPVAHGFPEHFRALVSIRPGGGVGRGAHYRLCPAALVAGHRIVGPRRWLRHLPVFQRHDVLHARLRRPGDDRSRSAGR